MTDKPSWRSVLPVHPAAELFPLMAREDMIALAEDIKKNGLVQPVVLTTMDGKPYVLDGRNRLDALEYLGDEIFIPVLKGTPRSPWEVTVKGWPRTRVHWSIAQFAQLSGNGDEYDFVIGANIQRRHLTSDQKRELIAKVLKARPEQSNNAIAEQVKVDDKTVAKVRTELESTSEIPKLEKTIGKDGKARKQPKKRDLEKERLAREERKVLARGDLPSLDEILAAPADEESEMPSEQEADDSWQNDLYDQACLLLSRMTDATRQRFFAHIAAKFESDDLDLPEFLRRVA
jgi:hypothetical protein